MPEKTRVKFTIPIGALASAAIFIYMITEGVWNKLSGTLKFLAVIGLIVLFLFGHIEYERSETKGTSF